MTALPGVPYYIAHPPAGSGGANDLFAKNHPVGAGRVQMLLGNNAMWLEQMNACRNLAAHPGFFSFTDHGTNDYAFDPDFAPTWENFHWNWSNQNKGEQCGANACLGYHYVWTFYGASVYPRLRLTFRYRTQTSGAKIAFYFGATTRQGIPGPRDYGSGLAPIATSDTEYHDGAMELDLAKIITAPVNDTLVPAPFNPSTNAYEGVGERVVLNTISVYVAAIVNLGAADMSGICLSIIPPAFT